MRRSLLAAVAAVVVVLPFAPVPDMTVLENVALGCYLRTKTGTVRAMLGLNAAEEAQARAEAQRQLRRSGSSRSPARWPATRRCCCWTNPLPACATRRRPRWPGC